MSGAEPVTEREFEDALRTFQAVWETKADLERQLGDERRRTEKLRNQISEQVVAQDGLREDLRAAQRATEEHEKRAERDRQTIRALEQQLAEAQRTLQRQSSCQRCSELEAQVHTLERDNGQLRRAASELESLRAYGKELQDLESASQVPSLAAPDTSAPERSPAGALGRRNRYSSAFAALRGAEETERSQPSIGNDVPAAGTACARSRLKLSKKHRSDQFESLGSEQQGGYHESEGIIVPRKKRCVSPTFDETEQQLSQSSQPSQPSQPIVDTPALPGEEGEQEEDEDDVPTSRWSSRDAEEVVDRTGHTSPQPEHVQATDNDTLAAEDSLLPETAAQEDSMAFLLDEVAKPARSGSVERGKENTLPTRRSASAFNVSTPQSSAVNHGCDEPAAAAAAGASAAVPSGMRGPATKPLGGTASPAPSASASQTQLTQQSPDLFPEEDCDATSAGPEGSKGTKAAGSSKFKVKLRARTPFSQSQRS